MSSKHVKQGKNKTSPPISPTNDKAKDTVDDKHDVFNVEQKLEVKPNICFNYCESSSDSNQVTVVKVKQETLDDAGSIEIDEPKIQEQEIVITVPTRRATADSDYPETEEDVQNNLELGDNENNYMGNSKKLQDDTQTTELNFSIETFINVFTEIIKHKDKSSHCSFMEAYGFIMTFRYVFDQVENRDKKSERAVNALLSRYTGIDSLQVLQIFLDALTVTGDLEEFKNVGLKPVDCILLTFLQIKICISFENIAKVFECDEKSAATCFLHTINKIKKSLGSVIYWPSREETEMTIPKFFKPAYSNVRTIFTNLVVQKNQNYKQRYVIGFAPSGFVSYISNGYNAETFTDEKIFRVEKIRQRFERNQDALMVLNGFPIENLLGISYFRIFRPPFIVKKVLPDNKTIVRENFALFKHVTETCSSLQKFQILSAELNFPSTYIDEIIFSICVCINYNVMFRNT